MSGTMPFRGPKTVAGLPVTVPTDFLGMTYHQHPGSTPTPSNVRCLVSQNHDYLIWGVSPTFWAKIEPNADGIYNWNTLDDWVNAHWSLGKKLSYTNIFCPTDYSQNSGVNSQWENLHGIGGPLTSGGLTAFGNFITALVTRYKNAGTPFTYLQPWQEPNFPSTPGVAYWWGSVNDLVDVAYVAYAAAKAADPSITVLSPSIFINQMDQFVTATGTINTTRHGYDTCDRWAADQFNSGAPCFSQGLPAYLPGAIEQPDWSIRLPLFKAKTAGHAKPLVISSHGFDYVADAAGTCQRLMRTATAETRKRWLARSLLYCAASGVAHVCLYTYDMGLYNGQYFCGDFVNDTNGVVAAVNEIADFVCGKTMTALSYFEGGELSAKFSDGTTYTI